MIHYRTFWVVSGLYFFLLIIWSASGMEFLKWLAGFFDVFGQRININRVPIYHFPDIWQNLFWGAGFLKMGLAIMVVISVTNEYSYRTIRQNIIDGLSRENFILSKILANLLWSLVSVVIVFFIALIAGLIYSPQYEFPYSLTGLDFLFTYFLEIFSFLSFSLMISMLIKRSGLTIILLIHSYLIELIIKANVDNYFPSIIPYFPLESISSLVPFPYRRYVFQEIRDYITVESVVLALIWIVVFNYLAYLTLKKRDI